MIFHLNFTTPTTSTLLAAIFRAQSARGEFARAREVHERSGRLKRVWERSGPHPSGGFTSRGAKRRVRFEKEITHPQGALTCTCTRSHTCVPESVHTCAHKCACRRVRTFVCTYCTRRVHEIHAPEGCTKNITARSNLRTHVIVSKSCERRVRHACAHLRCPRVHARVYTCTFGACIRTEGAVYEPRSEAESAPRKRKKQTEP